MAVPPICGPGPTTAAERSFNNYIKYGHNVPPPLGPLIRLHPKPLSSLPSRPFLPNTTTPNRPDISSYTTSLLHEAHTFITKILPRVFATETKARASPPAKASVQLSAHKVLQEEVPFETRPPGATGVAETWAARASEHSNAAEPGTASWEEFERGVGEEEWLGRGEVDGGGEHVVLDWGKELGPEALLGEGWEDVRAEVRKEVLRMPAMVDDRVFVVLVVSAKREGEFVVVKVPVDGAGLLGTKFYGAAGTTVGQRVSVDHGELVEDGVKYVWRKAISMDAGGMLPSWAQKIGGSGGLAKEVGAFVDWAQRGRSGKSMIS
jgi:hypothetical protein